MVRSPQGSLTTSRLTSSPTVPPLSDAAITWDCLVYHHRHFLLLPFLHHHKVQLVPHHLCFSPQHFLQQTPEIIQLQIKQSKTFWILSSYCLKKPTDLFPNKMIFYFQLFPPQGSPEWINFFTNSLSNPRPLHPLLLHQLTVSSIRTLINLPLWSCSGLSVWQFQPRHLSTVPPQHMSKSRPLQNI